MSAQADAIVYARKNFSKLVDRFQTDIQNLMGTLIYLPIGIENSPYKHLIAPEMWTEVSYIFLKDACSTLGISKDSPLSIVVNAGCLALPALCWAIDLAMCAAFAGVDSRCMVSMMLW